MRFISKYFLSLHRLKIRFMKRLFSFSLLLVVLAFTTCSGGNNEKNTGKPGNEVKLKEGVVNYLDADAFTKLVWDYRSSKEEWKFLGDQPCVIDFYADWCRPCKAVAPIMEELANQYKGQIRFYKVNTDDQRELASLFRISSIPAIMFIPKVGKPQMSLGLQPKENFVKAINEIILKK